MVDVRKVALAPIGCFIFSAIMTELLMVCFQSTEAGHESGVAVRTRVALVVVLGQDYSTCLALPFQRPPPSTNSTTERPPILHGLLTPGKRLKYELALTQCSAADIRSFPLSFTAIQTLVVQTITDAYDVAPFACNHNNSHRNIHSTTP
jgi:hypothetical protein